MGDTSLSASAIEQLSALIAADETRTGQTVAAWMLYCMWENIDFGHHLVLYRICMYM